MEVQVKSFPSQDSASEEIPDPISEDDEVPARSLVPGWSQSSPRPGEGPAVRRVRGRGDRYRQLYKL